jgi:Undecaprenyl-phosphate galactose phosphotransferase WbaP
MNGLTTTATSAFITDELVSGGGRYTQLDLVDRHAAESLNAYCRVNATTGEAASQLSQKALIQSWVTSLPLALSDVFSLYVSVTTAYVLIDLILGISAPLLSYKDAVFVSLIILPIASLAGLYPGLSLGPIVEFRELARVLFASLCVLAGLGLFCFPELWFFYTASAAASFVLALPVSATSRFAVRQLARRCRYWGMPTLLVAEGRRAVDLFRKLRRSEDQGIRPVGVLLGTESFDENAELLGRHGIPYFDIRYADEVAVKHSATWVIVSPCANREVAPTLDHSLSVIPHRVLLSSAQLDMGVWDQLVRIGATTGLQMGCAKPSQMQLMVKRGLDVTLTLFAMIVGLPLWITLCLLVKLSSRGPIFYGQQRMGRGGQEFKAWKFRTMKQNADQVLSAYLQANPKARAEWEEKHKLSKDPRVTKVGRFLRATSLDELPQLWNVLIGEMSLVGPRPIVDSPTYDACYVHDYPEEYEAYKTVRPGLTGLWQVRCRNSGVYELRIYWDMYYIRNWCIWLDIYLIMRTIRTVLFREGAY